jgi:DNA-binding Xre family transcriptional regulator
MSNETDNMVQIEWRLLQMMAERRIRRVTELRKKLLSLGIEISSQQIGRLVNQFPERLNTTYLRGLLTVLECDISDLIRVHPPGSKVGIEGQNQVYPLNHEPTVKPKKKRSKPTPQTSSGPALPPGFDD